MVYVDKNILRNVLWYFVEKVERNKWPQLVNTLIDTLNMNKEDKFGNIIVSEILIEAICGYCEVQAIYDKLYRYQDFYYKLKRIYNESIR